MEEIRYPMPRRRAWLAGAAAMALAAAGLAPMIDVEQARADVTVSGVVNTYQAVAGVSGDVVTVTGSLAGAGVPFAVGDRVMLIQMTGASPAVPGSNMGNYETSTITAISGSFISLAAVSRSYSPGTEKVQLVRIPYDAGTVTVSASVTAKPWDGTTGGVVALAGDTLQLDADIDASETGFTNAHSPTSAAQASLSVGAGSTSGRASDGDVALWRATLASGGIGGAGSGGGYQTSALGPVGGGGVAGGGQSSTGFERPLAAVAAPGTNGAAALGNDTELFAGAWGSAGGGGGVIGGGGGGASRFASGGGGGVGGGGVGGSDWVDADVVGSGGGGPLGVGNGGDGLEGGPSGTSDAFSENEGGAGGGGGSYGGGGAAASNYSGGDDSSGGGGGGSWTGGGAGGTGGMADFILLSYPSGGDGNAPVAAPIPDDAHYLHPGNPRLMMGGAGGRGSLESGWSQGGAGGGIVYLDVRAIAGSGDIVSDGGDGVSPGDVGGGAHSGAGGGAGGQMRIRVDDISHSSLVFSAQGGRGGTPSGNSYHGGVSGGGGGAGGVWVELSGVTEATCPAQDTEFDFTFALAGGEAGASITNPKNGLPTGRGGDGGNGLGCVSPREGAEPVLSYEKSSDPAPGTVVQPGDVITYTVTVGNDTDLTSVDGSVTDDMSAVLDKATMTATPALACSPASSACGELSYTAGETSLRWASSESAPLSPRTQASITYQVTIDDDATGTVGNVLVEPEVEVAHPILAHAKVSDPTTGTPVDPGDEVTYTITVENTGEVDTEQFTVFDDLSEVVDKASLDVSSIRLSPDVGMAVYDAEAQRLRWTGALEAGRSVDVSYTVTVNDDAFGVLRNHFLGEETEHPVSASLAWNKVDPDGERLAGSEWSLQALDDDGKPEGAAVEVVDCVEAPCTAADTESAPGQLLLTGLLAGEYTLTETRAPAGYVLDTTGHEITVGVTQQLTVLDDIENAPQDGSGLPLTGVDGKLLLTWAGIALVILAAGGMLVLLRRREASRAQGDA